MEFDNIVKLIKAVSDSSITNFVFEEGDVKLSLEKNTQTQVVSVAGGMPQQIVAQQAESKPASAEGKVLQSILVGVFYSAPGPNEEPFIKEGDTVKKGQIVGIIEAMKLMNEIECECSGVVEEILVKDGDMVEYGQPLFRIREA
ncbi:acetyl-CoA carboxylase biotin carboxyl carrier protein [Konateibacter massiliensis]|uniref:acetyl-CoA carboxylase biotin carboxyl carrier protein n=1 Tax=Konateibacter massiliensis TaxID=2002841 RepID=UPI000C15DD3A|nr:acetyl-CoA carboxylase biotin carboxyl carrier protein [Konateibacter massiliensis]